LSQEQPISTPASGLELITVFLVLLTMGFVVLFIYAMIGPGDANVQNKFETFAYISGLGAAPWGLLSLVSAALIGWWWRNVR
jgi:hypothetical protein